ncbi:thioredoxin family protein [Oceanispirochaeta sp.]|jgi:small redox-active disulfide protein 2|uniref:thioredoxin family protein n=1 Tax=Oceanispirochaeta sp. TaxID=2035350 RepID=UPI00261DD144|nr:thioredoxin family protein [Oceanispirochaeta sp.]MDA3958868.1 thioredoxin family protein [Oceanispirochaeta sp.]
MKIEVLGSGCARCKVLEKNTREAVKTAGLDAEIVKVEDMKQIMAYQVLSTPALVLDGKVISTGKLLNPDEIIALIQA